MAETLSNKRLRALATIAIEAASPLTGRVLKTALSQGLGVFLPDASGSDLDAEAERLAAILRERFEKRFGPERPAEDLEPVFATLETLLATHGPPASSWARHGYATGPVVAGLERDGEAVLGGLSADERRLVLQLAADHYDALFDTLEAMRRTERAFRRSTIGRLDEIAAAVDRLDAASRASAAELALETLLHGGGRRWAPERSPPAALLRAEYGVVAFHGREDEVRDLVDWAKRGPRLAVRLVTGPGGVGKSRLLFEVCERLASTGWTAGFLDPAAADVDPAAWPKLLGGEAPALVVIDYAETRRAETVAFLRGALEASAGVRRIVLLARRRRQWWPSLRTEGAGVGELLSSSASSHKTLLAAFATVGQRAASFDLARETFSTVLGVEIGDAALPDFAGPHYERVLLLHVAALLHLVEDRSGDEAAILDFLLDRERRFWREGVAALGIPEMLASAIDPVMAAVTLKGGVATQAETLDLLRGFPTLADQPAMHLDALSRLLNRHYQGDTCWVDPLLPDLLGEHLVETVRRDPGAEEALTTLVLGWSG